MTTTILKYFDSKPYAFHFDYVYTANVRAQCQVLSLSSFIVLYYDSYVMGFDDSKCN